MPREVGDWTQDKLKILSSYLTGYLGATTKASERVYIDGFAGPGRNTLKTTKAVIPGSPLIALNARAKNGTRFDRLFFIERDAKSVSELRRTAAGDKRVNIVEGDVNQQLASVLEQIPKRSPTFVFLDPVGIEPQWQTVAQMSTWRTELFINFPFDMAINRNQTSDKVVRYFGTKDCLPLFQLGRTAKVRGLLDLYKGRLADLGYVHQPRHERLIRTSGNRRLYYLLLASKSEVATKIMNWVFSQPDAKGQGQLL